MAKEADDSKALAVLRGSSNDFAKKDLELALKSGQPTTKVWAYLARSLVIEERLPESAYWYRLEASKLMIGDLAIDDRGEKYQIDNSFGPLDYCFAPSHKRPSVNLRFRPLLHLGRANYILAVGGGSRLPRDVRPIQAINELRKALEISVVMVSPKTVKHIEAVLGTAVDQLECSSNLIAFCGYQQLLQTFDSLARSDPSDGHYEDQAEEWRIRRDVAFERLQQAERRRAIHQDTSRDPVLAIPDQVILPLQLPELSQTYVTSVVNNVAKEIGLSGQGLPERSVETTPPGRRRKP